MRRFIWIINYIFVCRLVFQGNYNRTTFWGDGHYPFAAPVVGSGSSSFSIWTSFFGMSFLVVLSFLSRWWNGNSLFTVLHDRSKKSNNLISRLAPFWAVSNNEASINQTESFHRLLCPTRQLGCCWNIVSLLLQYYSPVPLLSFFIFTEFHVFCCTVKP